MNNDQENKSLCDESKQLAESNLKKSKIKKTGLKKEVYDGLALKTIGGLKKEDLVMNIRGKVVSLKRSESSKKNYGSIKDRLQRKSSNKEKPIELEIEENLNEQIIHEEKEESPQLNVALPEKVELNSALGEAKLEDIIKIEKQEIAAPIIANPRGRSLRIHNKIQK